MKNIPCCPNRCIFCFHFPNFSACTNAQHRWIPEPGKAPSAKSRWLTKGDDNPFESFCKEQSYDLEESFPVDKKTVTSMVKFSGLGGGVSISFERKHLGERVTYNEATDTLVIKGIPPNLKDQLQRFMEQEQD